MGHKSALVAVLLLGAVVGADVRQQQKTGKTKKRKSGLVRPPSDCVVTDPFERGCSVE
jgi:hypothetical protein